MTRSFVTPSHVDVLLTLRRAAPRGCRLEELADAASLPVDPVARRCLAELVDAGLARRCAGSAVAYRYAPASPTLDASVRSLAAAYRDRRVAVLRAIYGHTPVVRVDARPISV